MSRSRRATVAEEITLVSAAAELGIPYQDAHRLMLIRKLEGVRKGSRWWVRVESLRRLKAAMNRGGGE